MIAASSHTIRFALRFGGDRFPATTPREAFLAAQVDPATTSIVYYGELGGTDEYELAQLLQDGAATKPVACYIAGVIGENFDQPVQFGHAKALAGSKAKRPALNVQHFAKPVQRLQSRCKNLARLLLKFQLRLLTLTKNGTSPHERPVEIITISSESADGYEFVGRKSHFVGARR